MGEEELQLSRNAVEAGACKRALHGRAHASMRFHGCVLRGGAHTPCRDPEGIADMGVVSALAGCVAFAAL